MNVRWGIFISKTGFWLALEIWLNLIGLDNEADYGEFMIDQEIALAKKSDRTVKVCQHMPPFCHKINDFCPAHIIMQSQSNIGPDLHIYLMTFLQRCKRLKNPCAKVFIIFSNR